jgi:hypothetical protein
VEVGREQALAFRLAAHNLHRRLPAGSAEAAAAVAGLQDFPPGLAPVALAVRVEGSRPEDMDDLVIVHAFRGASIAVPQADVAVFTTALEPPDEVAARALIGSATDSLDEAGVGALDALDQVSAAVADALAAGPLERDDFHQALRERLPAELLWWCRGCNSHHVHPSLWRATGIKGVLAVAERRGRVTVFGAPPEARRSTTRRRSSRAASSTPTGRRPAPAWPAGPASPPTTRAPCSLASRTRSRRSASAAGAR